MHNYEHIISLENLLAAWQDFIRNKRSRLDVQLFGRNLMGNIISLHRDLKLNIYKHSAYQAFRINDPKPREIHKATVRDRVVHRALYRILYYFYHPLFISDSFSCRTTKGTHRALDRFRVFAYQASFNHTKTCWVLKCDVKKFFASIDHAVLLQVLRERITSERTISLLEEIIDSFHSTGMGVGLPLGNLTSQLLVNVYMNRFDQFVKHELKAEYYIRYADDFVILSHDRLWLESVLPRIREFLHTNLKLTLHPNKVSLTTVASGVDFLGWVHFPDHRVLRTSTKRRMFKNLQKNVEPAVQESYLGLLKWGNTWKLKQKMENLV